MRSSAWLLNVISQRHHSGNVGIPIALYEVDFHERTAFVDDRFSDVFGIPPAILAAFSSP